MLDVKDRERIKINSYGSLYAPDIPENHGFILKHFKTDYHPIFTNAGVITSPGNSERIFLENRTKQYYIFNGWEADEFGRCKKNAQYIQMINVTDLI